MTRRAVAVLAVAVAATLSWTSVSAAASSFTIRTSGGYIVKIGSMSMRGAQGGTLAAATRAFGRPTKIDPIGDGSDACRVSWSRLKFNAVFANFGIDSACSPRGGRLQSATTRSSRFRTTRGVRVGSASRTIPDKHRDAEFVNGAWWIASLAFLGDEDNVIPSIKALVGGGKVRGLSLFIGAAGD